MLHADAHIHTYCRTETLLSADERLQPSKAAFVYISSPAE